MSGRLEAPPGRHPSALVAWSLVGVTAVAWLAGGVMWRAIDAAQVPTPGRDPVALLIEVAVGVLVLGAMGGVIAARRPRNPIGWILAGAAFLISVKAVTGIYVDYGRFLHGGHIAMWAAAAWLSNWTWLPALGSYGTFLFLLFPTGHPPTRRWRIAGWLAGTAIGLAVVSVALAPGRLDQFPYVTNPVALPRWTGPFLSVAGIGFPLLPASAALCVTSMVVRYRRAGAVEREQIKWIAFAGLLLVLGFVVDIGFNRFDAFTAPLIFGPLAGVAVACAIAIQRHNLFAIDRVISRTIAYAVVTVVLGSGYALVTLVPTALAGGGRVPAWAIAGATLVSAGLFRPVRRKVQDAVDRRFNRSRYDAARTIEMFAGRLREELDIDTLRVELVGVVRETMQPTSASLWLRAQ